MNGFVAGVFGTNKEQKGSFEDSVAKKSEVEGIVVYHRNESGVRYSFLDDDAQFPDRIQGYARIASLSDYAYYMFPSNGKLTVPDGELALLVDAYGLQGRVEIIDAFSEVGSESVQASLKGLSLASFPIDRRDRKSSIIDLSVIKESNNFPKAGTMIYIDRAFSVKGVGVVVLGFILSGQVSVHDKLRLLPNLTSNSRWAEVKGIQVSDVDFDSAGRGIRVGLSLKGVEVKDLSKTSWLDDGSFPLSSRISFNFRKCAYYKQEIAGRDLHVQLPGELLLASISKGTKEGEFVASLSSEVPCWSGMKVCVIDLNSKNLRVAGAGSASI